MVDIFQAQAARVSTKRPRQDRTGALLDQLSDVFVAGVRQHKVRKDQRSQAEAASDILSGTINPEREANEIAYSRVILNNRLQDELTNRINSLDDPASETAAMPPAEYLKSLQNDYTELYNSLSGQRNSEVLAEDFGKFTLKNQALLIGKQTQQHLMFQTNKSAEALKGALDASGGLDKDLDFNEHMGTLMEDGWNKSLLKRDEVADIMLGAAVEQARNGDRRLLDYAEQKWGLGSDPKHMGKVKVGNHDYEKFVFEAGEAEADQRYKDYTVLAEQGLFTDEMFDDLFADEEAKDRWKKPKIVEWWRTSRRAQTKATKYSDDTMAFDKFLPMSWTSPEAFQKVSSEWINSRLAVPGVDVEAVLTQYAKRLSRQGRINTGMKRELNSWFGNFATSDKLLETPGQQQLFDRAMAIGDIFENTMPRSMFIDQMGDDAYRNWELLHFYARANGGDMQAAIEQIRTIQSSRQEKGLDTRLAQEEIKEMDAQFDDIRNGTHDSSDPHMRKFWGYMRRGSASVMTAGINREIRKAYEASVLTGLQPALAMSTAGELVAKQYKTFGNELQFTGGANIGAFIGMDVNADPASVEGAFHSLAESLGKDPDDVHVQVAHGMATVSIMEDGKIIERKFMPSALIGEQHELSQIRKAEEAEYKSVAAREAADLRANTSFLSTQGMYHDGALSIGHVMFGAPVNGIVVPAYDGNPAVTYNELITMDPKGVARVRKMHHNYRIREIVKVAEVLSDLGGAVSGYIGEAATAFTPEIFNE